MAFRGRGRGVYRSDTYAATSAQFNYPAPEHNITRHPSCNVAEVPDDWLYSLKHSWNVFKASDRVKGILYGYLNNCENPYASALQIMAENTEFYHSKAKSLASFVMESFASWIAPQEHVWAHCLTKELKEEAFHLLTQQKNIVLTKLVFKTFHLVDNAPDYLDQIRFMVNCKRYKEACQCASLLNLTHYFTLEDFVLPLVLQDKHVVAEEALVQVPEMQKELVIMLDDLLGSGKNLSAEIDNLNMKLDVPDVKYEVFYNPKPLGKLIARLIKRFQLPEDLAPHLNKKRTGGALQFLIRKRYKDNLNSESWNEMVKEAVGDDPQLQMELVLSVNNYGDYHEALYWAHYYNIPKERWPLNVRLLDRDDPEAKYCQPKTAAEEDEGAEEKWGSEDIPFHQLSLPDSSLVMVDTVEAMHELVQTFSFGGVTIAGIDSEWKPAFAGRQSELALVQVATADQVFIIDIVNLGGKAPEVWNQLGNCFFRNKDILKLGFDVGNDLQMIKTALPDLGQIKQNGHGYLDLSLLWKRLTNNHKLILPYRDASQGSSSESLSQLVFLTLGRALNKANQFSNWEQRPLRIGQIRYAALDAFCLLDVYQILRQCSEDQNIPFFEICDEIMLNYKGPRKSAGNNASKKKSSDMVPSALSNIPVTPRIDPPAVVNRSDPSVETEPTSEQLICQQNDKLLEDIERVSEMLGSVCGEHFDIMDDFDGEHEVDEHAQGLWRSDVEACIEDLEGLINDGKKFFGLQQDDSETRHYCWYHARFGIDSHNCQPPCDFDKEYSVEAVNDSGSSSQAGWESEVKSCLKDLEELMNDGMKFIMSHRNESYSQEDTREHCICWYHSRFGVDAVNCQPPCDFDGKYPLNEWCLHQRQVLKGISEDLEQIALHLSHSQSLSQSHKRSRNRSRTRLNKPPSNNQSPDRSYRSSRSQSRDRPYKKSRYPSHDNSRSHDLSFSPSYNQSQNQSYNQSHDRSYNQSWNQSPSWSPSNNDYFASPQSLSSSEMICWYHREFGESAKRCQSPCDFYDGYAAEYVPVW